MARRGRRRSWPLYGGVLAVVAALVLGGLLLTGVVGGTDDDRPRRRPLDFATRPVPASTAPASRAPASTAPATPDGTSPEGPSTPGTRAPGVLSVVDWGHTAGQLAVLVRNESRELIARAQVRVTARDGGGRVLVASSGTRADVCCTVLGLRSGDEFGLFLPLGAEVGTVATVEVEAIAAETGSAEATGTVVADRGRLQRLEDDTVVRVRLRAKGRQSGYVAVQALLTDAEGRLAQVVSGRFYCFAPGTERTIRLRLFHPVPAGVRLHRVLAQPVPAGVRAHVPGRCG